MSPSIRKFPRTRHIEGSRFGPGDEDLDDVPFAQLRGHHLVVEEKVDGANAAISFAPRAPSANEPGELLLQSRGHYLTGGAREVHFDMLKQWAQTHADVLSERLGVRYVMYGEWLYAKHTVYYDALPHYFLEFDVLDTETGTFLSTSRRRELLNGTPVRSVEVLHEGLIDTHARLLRLVGPSRFKTAHWLEHLRRAVLQRGLDVERAVRETDPSIDMEGLYIKVEEEGRVVERYKWVRATFLTRVLDSASHWLTRPIVPNSLAPGVDLFAGRS